MNNFNIANNNNAANNMNDIQICPFPCLPQPPPVPGGEESIKTFSTSHIRKEKKI